MHRINNLLLLFIIFSSVVIAQPPFQTSENQVGQLNIIFPKEDSFNINKDIKLHFHIFNSSGYSLNVSDVDCRIHIYDHDGNHLIDKVLDDGTETELTNDKEIYLTKDNFTKIGDHSFATWCNSSNEAGYISGSFHLNNQGFDNETNPLFIIIGLLGLSLILLYFAFNLDEVHTFLKFLLIGFSTLFLYIIPKVFLDFTSGNYGIISFKLMQGFIYIFFLYFFLYFTYLALDFLGYATGIREYIKSRTRGKK